MTTYVAFLRAINVAGHATVRMDDLAALFRAARCRNVRAHIQSGNVTFDCGEAEAPAAFQRIRARLRKLVGGEAVVAFRRARDLERLVAQAPFRGLEGDRTLKLYVSFLMDAPQNRPRFPLRSVEEALDAIRCQGLEVFIVSRRKKNGFYGFPNNFIEKQLGVPATTRNWSTITRIVAAIQAPAGEAAPALRRRRESPAASR